ncbi:MAG TPA: four helix bundle protein [Balneolaceae bacterium]|nr:four helix bundle protein [Balneolaceae bacterium]
MRPHYNLEAWKNSMDLVDHIYEITARFPKDEKFGLSSQMRRASISVPSNISEGAARNSTAEFANFVNIARGSLSELETQIIISKRQRFIKKDKAAELIAKIEKVSSQLSGLYKHLKSKKRKT